MDDKGSAGERLAGRLGVWTALLLRHGSGEWRAWLRNMPSPPGPHASRAASC